MRLYSGLILLIAWVFLFTVVLYSSLPPKQLITAPCLAWVKITSIPESRQNQTSFRATIFALQTAEEVTSLKAKLSWNNPYEKLHIGDRWIFLLKLKPATGWRNTAGFHYATWLLSERIQVTGYILSGLLLKPGFTINCFELLREKINEALTKARLPLEGLITALAIGMRTEITTAQWDILRGTGTNHLFAIAGLHIGLVSGIAYLATQKLWCYLGKLPLYLPASQAARICALFTAVFYSGLAGLSLPTQRALIMLAVFLIASLTRKKISIWTPWRLACLLLLFIEPLSILASSFWLSFSSVALILYSLSSRIAPSKGWIHWLKLQAVLSIGLIPICLWFFQQASLAGFIANTAAIPWVGFFVLPLCVLGDIAWLFSTALAHSLWLIAAKSLNLIWPLLNYLAHLAIADWSIYFFNRWIFFSAMIGVVILLMPAGIPGRWLSLIWFSPMLLYTPPAPAIQEVWLSLLDVGQGLCAVIRTTHHTLIYTTGLQSSHLNISENILIPFLQAYRLNKIDKLILTNSHMIGGITSLAQHVQIEQLLTPRPQIFKSAISCDINQYWNWDGIRFQILYLPKTSSCVLQVAASEHNYLILTGPLRKTAQNYLINHSRLQFTDLLIPPIKDFLADSIQSIHPKIVLFSSRPDKLKQLETYREIGSHVYITGCEGELSFAWRQEKWQRFNSPNFIERLTQPNCSIFYSK